MRILWITKLPEQIQREALGGDYGAQHPVSWIVAHLPPPPDIDLHLACLWPGGAAPKTVTFRGATVHLVPCPRRGRAASFFLRDARFYGPLYKALRPDLVHGWGTEDSNGLVAVRLAPERHVVGIQGVMNVINTRNPPTVRDRVAAAVERFTLARARHVVAESVFAAGAGGRWCRKTEPVVVPQPVRRDILEAEPDAVPRRQAVFLGRIARQKGIDDAVEAFARAAPKDWTLTIVGSGSPRERRRLESGLRAFDLSSRTVCIEHLPESGVTRLLQESALLVLPTRADSGPTVLKEALCLGVWPVCYDNTGPGELIRAFGYGTLARDGDKGDLVRCLLEAFREEPWGFGDRRKACAAAARSAFARERAWEHLRRLYAAVLAEGHGEDTLVPRKNRVVSARGCP